MRSVLAVCACHSPHCACSLAAPEGRTCWQPAQCRPRGARADGDHGDCGPQTAHRGGARKAELGQSPRQPRHGDPCSRICRGLPTSCLFVTDARGNPHSSGGLGRPLVRHRRTVGSPQGPRPFRTKGFCKQARDTAARSSISPMTVAVGSPDWPGRIDMVRRRKRSRICTFVFNDTKEKPRTPACKPGRVTEA
jgi:hypothetical protein